MTSDSLDRLKSALADRYSLDRELGSGGMATVYLATDLKHRRKVAVKVLKPDVGAALGAKRFLREIEIAAGLVHPHILGLHDSGELEGQLFFVMPFVEGESLRDRLSRQGRRPLNEVTDVVRAVADALTHAHARGVVHRDIKPENILFEAGHAIVSDFGVARAVTAAGDDTMTATGVVVGTPAYMSPEQALGEPNVDARCDVYSLGCVAYEMLSGERPFAGTNAHGALARKLTEDPAGVRSVARDVEPAVDAVVRKAMARSPSDRYATAKEFSDAFQAAAVGNVRTSVRPSFSRNATLAAGAALLLLVAFVIWRTRDASAASVGSIAVLPFDSPGADSAQPYFVDGMHDALIGELGKISALRVISRTSVMRFRGAKLNLSQIAESLGVDAIVAATLYRLRDSVRIQMNLVQTRPAERQLWSQSYSGALEDVFALSANVAQAVASRLQVTVTPQEQGRFATVQQGDAAGAARSQAVNDLYLEGRHWLNRRTAEGMVKAEAAFRRAIAMDSTFAAAHASLASALALINDWHWNPIDPIAVSREGIIAANKALSLDSLSAEALAARARILSAARAPEELVRRDFERAIRVMPHHANAHGWFAMELAWRGHAAPSRAQNDTSISLDPLAPGRHMGFAISAINIGDLDVAMREARRVVLLEPALLQQGYIEAVVLVSQGRGAECIETPQGRNVALRAVCLHAAGRAAEGKRLADSLSARTEEAFRRGAPYTDMVHADILPLYYALIGDVDKTLHWFRQATRISTAPSASLLINTKLFDRVKQDPRFVDGYAKIYEDVWRRINTPPLIQ